MAGSGTCAESEVGSRESQLRSEWVLTTLAVGCALAAALLLLISLLSFESLAPRIHGLAWDGEAEPFTPAFHAGIVARARVLAGLLAALAAGVAWQRRGLAGLLAGGAARLTAGARELAQILGAAARRDGAGHWLLLGAVSLVGLGLRLAYLSHPLRRDEAFSFNNFISHPFPVALSNYAPYYGNNNHLLNTLLAKLSCLAFGSSPAALRLPVLVAGVLSIPLSYAAARLLHDRRVGLLVGAFVATSPFLVARSTDARGYSFVVLASVACLALAALELRRRNDFAWLLFALSAALGLYAIPIMLLPLGGIGCWWAANAWRAGCLGGRWRELGVALLASGALAGLLYAPVWVVSGLGSLIDNHWVQARSPAQLAIAWPELAGQLGGLLRDDPVWPLGLVLPIAFVVAAVFHQRLARQPFPIWLAVLLWCAVVVAVQRVVPFVRVWSFLIPIYLLGASAGLVFAIDRVGLRRTLGKPGWAEPGLAAAVVALLLASSLSLLRSDRIYRDTETGGVYAVDAAARWIQPRLEPGDRVLGNGAPSLLYELSNLGVPRDGVRPVPGEERRLLVLASDPDEARHWLHEDDLSPADFRAPEAIADFPGYVPTRWYRFDRRVRPAHVSAGP